MDAEETSGEPEPATEATDLESAVENHSWSELEKIEWSRGAKTEGVRTLEGQLRELGRMRWSSIALAFGSIAIGLGFSPGVPIAAISLVSILLLILILFPYHKFQFWMDPRPLLRWQTGDRPAPDLGAAEHALAGQVGKMIDYNRPKLRLIRFFYSSLILSSSAIVGCAIGESLMRSLG